MVRERFPDVKLILVGAGREEQALKSLCRQLGMEDAVGFAGHVDPPYAFFARTTLFVLPSRHEGMPNALLEAAAAGLPIVATPASGGVVDLLTRPSGRVARTGNLRRGARQPRSWQRSRQFRPGERFSQDVLRIGCRDDAAGGCGKRPGKHRAFGLKLGTRVINNPLFPVKIYFLTFFSIGCFLWVQFQYSFSTPRVGKCYQGHSRVVEGALLRRRRIGRAGPSYFGL